MKELNDLKEWSKSVHEPMLILFSDTSLIKAKCIF